MTIARKLLNLSGAALVGLAFAVGSVQAADTIKIGVPVGLSGANSVVAPSVVQATELAAAEINAAGGKVPYIYTSFYEGRSCSPWMYVNAWVPEQQVAPVVDHFMNSEGAKTFFLIGSDYAFGRGMLEFTQKYIEQQASISPTATSPLMRVRPATWVPMPQASTSPRLTSPASKVPRIRTSSRP